MAREHHMGFGTMSKKLALSSALSVALMAAFALFGQQATASHATGSSASGLIEVSAAAIGR
jgi:hypothetical protein